MEVDASTSGMDDFLQLIDQISTQSGNYALHLQALTSAKDLGLTDEVGFDLSHKVTLA